MKHLDDIISDEALRMAVRRRAARRQNHFPADANLEANVMRRIGQQRLRRRRLLAAKWAAAAAAVVVLAAGGLHLGTQPDEPKAVCQNTVEASFAECPAPPLAEVHVPLPAATKPSPTRPANPVRTLSRAVPTETRQSLSTLPPPDESPGEPQQAEVEAPQLPPPDKQTLADLYLAEEVLQVVYNQLSLRQAVDAYFVGLAPEGEAEPACYLCY